MFIPVVLKNGNEELVSKNELQKLLSKNQIMFFKRSSGWVVIGRDKIRERNLSYRGVERRKNTGFSLENH